MVGKSAVYAKAKPCKKGPAAVDYSPTSSDQSLAAKVSGKKPWP